MNDKITQFIEYVKKITFENNIKFIVSDSENIKYPNSKSLVSGYFIDYGNSELGISIGGDVKIIFMILN